MQRKPLFWFVVSMLCLAGAVYFWRLGDRWQAEKYPAPKPSALTGPATPSSLAKAVASSPIASTNAAKATNHYPYRLSNTTQTSDQLIHNDKALLLMNALLDTAQPVKLAIPDRLRATPNSGSYLVQARGALDDKFRAALRGANATIVSYIPNNAYLVRVSDPGATQLAANPRTQSVLPFEPYYKLDPSLLKLALEKPAELPPNGLTITVFADAYQATRDALRQIGAAVVGEDKSPFGPVLKVQPLPGTLSSVASIPGVQGVAALRMRKQANDLMRVRLGVSTDTVTNDTWLGLTGTNVVININDGGVDMTHPDLVGRVSTVPLLLDGTLPFALTDFDGHGTHVAGTIIGSGTNSFTITNAQGSVTNANFRGIAPNATAFVLSILPFAGDEDLISARDYSKPFFFTQDSSDFNLQQQAALTKARISNNSWNYLDASYDIEAASYDAAVRDTLPGVPGSQPMLYVFSAGNDGNGSDDGTEGNADSILSPGTAKNVITVGAIEQPRGILVTNISDVNGTNVTNINTLFLAPTDANNQVASFSSRGNVGINGVEGSAGRFKPDVVAPGTFVISDRSSQWDTNAYYNPTNFTANSGAGIVGTNAVTPATTIFLPANLVGIRFFVTSNSLSPKPFPLMPIYVGKNFAPTLTHFDFRGTNAIALPTNGVSFTPGSALTFSVGNSSTQKVAFSWTIVLITTNDNGYFLSLSNLNNEAGQYYRFESGTSMAAAGVSGMLACMQELFERVNLTNSPALMKALLINGARSIGQPYDFDVGALNGNSQGWGLPNLPNTVPAMLTNLHANLDNLNTMPVVFVDQSPENALATGQSKTYDLTLSEDGQFQDLRFTLVWTDPPGNPAAGVKLVNDLDLIVSNIVDQGVGDVFFGNDIPGGSIYSESWDTNGPPIIDSVNNVENVFLQGPLSGHYTVTVRARRVNVNALTANTNDIVQDYALVISSGDSGAVASPFTAFTDLTASGPVTNSTTNVFGVTNGLPLFNQRVGANSQFSGSTNGTAAQWNFYLYTNTPAITNGTFTNVAIVTFASPNLGVVRMGAADENGPFGQGSNPDAARYAGADIDLYVSTDPGLTNLDTNVINNTNITFKSTSRTGAEKVLFTNSTPGQVYYIGVKSDDQQAGQFGLFAVAINQPFDQTDGNGNTLVTMLTPFPVDIPPGSPGNPNHALILGVSTSTATVRKVTVTNTVTHTEFGDLIGTLTHSQNTAVLNNHSFFTNLNDTVETFVYDDSGENVPGTRPSEGPGSLRNFVADKAADGVWQFTMVNDSSLSDTGQVNNFVIAIDPQPETNGFTRTILGNSWFYDFVDIPLNATNLTIFVSQNTLPVDLFIERGDFPDFGAFDKSAVISPPGGSLSINKFESPPLNPGRYFYGIFNPNATAQTVFIVVEVGQTLTPETALNFLSPGNEVLLDDAVTYSTNTVGQDGTIVSAEVGVRIDHVREADLVLTLISPQGTRVLLAENRGIGTNGVLDTNGYGSGFNTTNVLPATTAGDFHTDTNSIGLAISTGTLIINYDMFTVPDDLRVYYGGNRIYDTGLVSGQGTIAVDFGPGSATNIQILMNEAGSNPATNTQWTYTATVITRSVAYAVFSDDTNKTTQPIKFAPPPFGRGAVSVPAKIIFTNSFEGAGAGAYNLGDVVDGWTVTSIGQGQIDQPTVAAVPQLADNGNNVLALHGSTITRVLPTVAGKDYTLKMAYHGKPIQNPVSWWKGDGSLTDTMAANNLQLIGQFSSFGSAKVKQGIQFFGFFGYTFPNFSRVNAGNPANLELTNALTVEGWVSIIQSAYNNGDDSFVPSTIIERGDNQGNNAYHLGVDTGNNLIWYITDATHVNTPMAQAPWPGVIGFTGPTLEYVTGTYDHATSKLNLYINGTLVSSQNQPNRPIGFLDSANLPGVSVGDSGTTDQSVQTSFSGTVDEMTVYSRALSVPEIQDIYAAGSAGKRVPGDNTPTTATITLDNAAFPLSASLDQWVTNTIVFTASNNNMVLTISSDTNIDGTVQDGILLDSVALVQNAVPNSANYYLPEEALSKLAGEDSQGDWLLEILDNRAGATNPAPVLVSWQLSLVLADKVPFAIPLSTGLGQSNTLGPNSIAYFLVDVPPWALFATNTLTASGPVNLLFNQGLLPTGTNVGDITLLNSAGVKILNTTNGTPLLVPGQRYFLGVQNPNPTTTITFSLQVDFDITTLTNAVPVTSTIAQGNVPRYFQFDVDTNTVVTLFQISNPSGNVELVVRDGPPLPDTTSFDYFSAVPGASPQSVVVATNSTPVPLTPGRWYLGVFNNDVVPVTYTITATEGFPPNIITLTNGVPFNYQAPPGPVLTNFFLFAITNAPAALFELYNLTGNVDLTLDRDALPYTPSYFGSSANPGTNREQIVIRTNIVVTNLDANWYLGVPNNTAGNVNFTIRAIVSTNGLLLSVFPIKETIRPPIIGSGTGPSISWPSVQGEHYEIDVSTDLITWTVLTTVTGFGTTTTFTDPTPVVGPQFYRVIQVP